MKKNTKFILIAVACFMLYLLLSFILFYIENGVIGSGGFNSIWDTLWYLLSAFFAIGYEDIIGLTILGKIIDVGVVIAGLCFLGLIIGNITNIITERSEKRKLGFMGTKFTNHIIIIGWDKFAEDVATQLIGAGKKIAVMTVNRDNIDLIYQKFDKKDAFVCFSEINKYLSLELLNIYQSQVIFLNYGDDSEKLVEILNIKKQYVDAKFVVILDNPDLKDTFVSAGVTYVMSKNEIASKLVASYIFEPAVADYEKDLLSSAVSESEYDIQQYKVITGNPFINRKYGDMFAELKNNYNIIAIGLNKKTENDMQLIKSPKDDILVNVEDDVIVIANGATEKIMQKIFKVSEGA
ncbi:MAG: NAD-binding protein [Eubacteriales bacterium]